MLFVINLIAVLSLVVILDDSRYGLSSKPLICFEHYLKTFTCQCGNTLHFVNTKCVNCNYIAQPMLMLLTAPTMVKETVEPRYLDLRPFILSGKNVAVTTGDLTRVALTKGSIVVNSSQGGGSKDTWIVDMESSS